MATREKEPATEASSVEANVPFYKKPINQTIGAVALVFALGAGGALVFKGNQSSGEENADLPARQDEITELVGEEFYAPIEESQGNLSSRDTTAPPVESAPQIGEDEPSLANRLNIAFIEVKTESDVLSVIEEINARRHIALASGNTDLLDSVYGKDVSRSDGQYKNDLDYINEIRSIVGVDEYSDEYTHVESTYVMKNTVSVVSFSGEKLVVSYQFWEEDNQRYNANDTYVIEEGVWTTSLRDVSYLGSRFDCPDDDTCP